MSKPLDEADPAYVKLRAQRKEIILGTLSVRARVDETKLRGAKQDDIGELLERLRAGDGAIDITPRRLQ